MEHIPCWVMQASVDLCWYKYTTLSMLRFNSKWHPSMLCAHEWIWPCIWNGAQAAHHGRGGCGLVHLVLGGLNFGLQMRWRVEVLALFPGAAPLDVVHAHSHCVVIGVYHGAVCRMGEAAVVLSPGAVASLVLPTHLKTDKKDYEKTFGVYTYVNTAGWE